MRQLTVLAIAGVFAAAAFAQHDPNSVWPQFKANDAKSASVAAPGPAAVLDWYVEPDDPNDAGTIPSPGGFTLDGDGYIYHNSRDDTGCRVYKLDPADGSLVVKSELFDCSSGNYAGVAIGINHVYTCVYKDDFLDARIVKLDKTTLATVAEFDGGGAFGGLRGTPLIGDIPNDNGNPNLYVYDRDGWAIYAVDSVTGALMGSYNATIIDETYFGQLGPMWVTGDGRQAFAFFQNYDDPAVGWGLALADNGDGTLSALWENGGPTSKNWIGSGAMSFDGQIYVGTYWDLQEGVLTKVDRSDGSIIWEVPWSEDPNDPNAAYNYGFCRPAVVGNRVYCGGGWGQIVCYEDLGNSYQYKWEMRDNVGEYTCVSAALDGDDVYVYGGRQSDGPEVFVVLRDDGDTYTEIARHTLDQATATQSLYANNSCTIDADGSVYVGLGRAVGDNGVADPAAIYKFKVGSACPGDIDGDGDTDHSDLGALLAAWCSVEGDSNWNPNADLDGDGHVGHGDLGILLADWGCGT